MQKKWRCRLLQPARPADAVDVILRRPWQVEVDYMADAIDIKAARSDIRGHQEPDLASPHIHDGAIASRL